MLHIDVKRIRKLRLLLDQISYYIIVSNVAKTAINSLPEKTKLLVRLFHLNEGIDISKFEHIFGGKILADLLKLNLLVINGCNIRCNYTIASLNNCYIVHETNDFNNKLIFAYYSYDSLILAKNLPLNFNAIKTLDLCSGTGIQAILLARRGGKIVGVELSPEVANIARFNIILNNMENKVKILQGDLYKPVQNMKFDLIVSNPPFIPVPDSLRYPLCGKGGEDGLLVLKNIFTDIGSHMTKNGTGLILGETYGDHRYPFVLNLLKTIAERDKLDIDVFILERSQKFWEKVLRIPSLLTFNPNPDLNIKAEMDKLYDKANAEYFYTYLIKVKRGKHNVNLISLFAKNSAKKKAEISKQVFLKSLHLQLVDSFLKNQYDKTIDIYKNMEKIGKIFEVKYERGLRFILGISYKKLKQYKKAIIELRKAEKKNPKEAWINFCLFECYQSSSKMEEADRQLKKWFLKLKKSNHKCP